MHALIQRKSPLRKSLIRDSLRQVEDRENSFSASLMSACSSAMKNVQPGEEGNRKCFCSEDFFSLLPKAERKRLSCVRPSFRLTRACTSTSVRVRHFSTVNFWEDCRQAPADIFLHFMPVRTLHARA